MTGQLAASFDAYYYAHGCGQPYARDENWLGMFARLAGQIHTRIAPGSVLDAGCAWGLLVEALRRRQIEAYGIDISEYAIQQVAPEMQPYCRIGSITQPFERRYDLIVSIEVVEHLHQADSEAAVANLCRYSDDILFSSTPLDYREATHFNVQPPEYWADQFAQHGFFRDVDFDASFLTPWAVRFRRRSEPLPRLIRDYERKYWPLYKENTDLRSLNLELRDQLSQQHAALEQQHGTLDDLQRQLATAQQQLDEVHRSRTWRWGQKLAALRRRWLA